MTPVKKGFTLIELVMVIIILGILAGVIMPKFLNFKNLAIEKSEDSIAGSLNTAIKMYCLSYTTVTGESSSFPAVNPFQLLAQAPPNFSTGNFGANSNDNYRWRVFSCEPSYTQLSIFCPHYAGNDWGDVHGKGRCYTFLYGTNAGVGGHKPGDFWKYDDEGH